MIGSARRARLADQVAVGASFLCLLHCLALPLLVALMPVVATILPDDTHFHLLMLFIAIPVSGISLVVGCVRHGRAGPLFIGLTGLLLLIVAVATLKGRSAETLLTLSGALLLAAAHIANLRVGAGCAAEHVASEGKR